MNNKGLITTLDVIFSDNNLPVLGDGEILHVDKGTVAKSFYIETIDSTPVTVKCDENATFDNGERAVFLANGSGTVTLDTITDDTILLIGPFNSIKKLVCKDGTSDMSSGTAAGWSIEDESAFSECENITDLAIRGINSLDTIKNMSSLGKIQMSNSPCTDSIEKLGKLINTTIMYFRNSQFTGDIKNMATSMVSNGRVSGSLSVYGNGIITNNGTVITNSTYKTIQFSRSYEGGFRIM